MNQRTVSVLSLVCFLIVGCGAFPRYPDRKPTLWEVITAYTNPQSATATPVAIAALPQADASSSITGTNTITGTSTITSTGVLTGTGSLTGTVPVSGTGTLTGTAPARDATGGTAVGTQVATQTPMPSRTGAPLTATLTATPIVTNTTPRPLATNTPTLQSTPTQSATREATATRRVDPTPDKTATMPPSPPEAPIQKDVYIRSHVGHSNSGEFVVVGEIINGESYPIYGAKIIGTFLDANGQIVGAQEELAYFPKTDVEETNPFQLAVSDPGGQIESYELSLRWEEISIIEFMAVDVLSAKVDDETGLVVTGEIRNSQGTNLTSVIVTITFYDEDGSVVGAAEQFYGAQVLPPGEATPYSISINDPTLEYDTFRVQAQGNVNLF